MIYGLNFNRTPIPPQHKRRFAARIKLAGMARNEWLYLAGICTEQAEVWRMVDQATNGHRQIHVRERSTKNGSICGIYVS